MRQCAYHDRVGCPMTRVNRVRGDGPVPCHIMLIGEAPGKMEDAKGRPFIGKSGSELTYLYLGRCADIDRANVYVANTVGCRTNDKDRDPTEAEIQACGHVLMDEIRTVQPQCIGLVGRVAAQFILGDAFVGMDKMHGFGYRVVFTDGDDRQVRVMPLYHPAYGLHNTTMMRWIMEDFTRFGRMVRGDEWVMWRERR